MGKFRIQSHGRLQEWVAEEKDYFKDEGLDYEFIVKPIATWSADVQSVETAPSEIPRGAFESTLGTFFHPSRPALPATKFPSFESSPKKLAD